MRRVLKETQTPQFIADSIHLLRLMLSIDSSKYFTTEPVRHTCRQELVADVQSFMRAGTQHLLHHVDAYLLVTDVHPHCAPGVIGYMIKLHIEFQVEDLII